MTAIAETPKDNLFDMPGCVFTETALEIEPGMPFEAWEELGRKLRAAGKGLQFWIGDWIRYGEHEYGEKYAQAIEATGREAATLQNYVYVAQNIHSSRRRDLDIVDFSTHAEVASLPPEEQERLLARAAHEDSTVRDIRKEVHRTKRKLGLELTEIEVIHSVDVQAYLARYVSTLKELEGEIPITAPFLKNMVHAQIGQAQWQAERTIADDCSAILEMFEGGGGTEGVYRATDNDIFQWLQRCGYFMRDPELDERLALMVRRKMLECTPQGGRKEGQKGDMPDLYQIHPEYLRRHAAA